MAEKPEHTIPPASSRPRDRVEAIYGSEAEPYEVTLSLQEKLFQANLTAKANGRPTRNTLIICEHLPVYTLGKSANENNMLLDPGSLGAALFRTSRGGDITFHGPGQMVVYPIFDLETLSMGLAGFVHALEDVVIRTVSHFGIPASRLHGAPGIWTGPETSPQKICAIGLRASRYCTMHGIALNVNTDLRYFDYIVPCGIPGKGVTSLAKELNKEVLMTDVRDVFIRELEKAFGFRII